jgi:hypothetical protein
VDFFSIVDEVDGDDRLEPEREVKREVGGVSSASERPPGGSSEVAGAGFSDLQLVSPARRSIAPGRGRIDMMSSSG